VTRAFEAPESQYTAGHRGIDLASEVNDAVFAPHDGVVSFAGRVVDRPVLSITQPDDLISTVEPVIATVAAGDRVRAGQVIGAVSSGGHCPPGCLHFGVRLHGLYVSPLLFLGTVPRAILLPAVP
jgi:murein DD-endopeptidase MepM/ murein hydrolase activator NlpD